MVSLEVRAGRRGRCTDYRDCGYGASRDGHAGTSMHFEPTAHHGFSSGDDGDRVDRVEAMVSGRLEAHICASMTVLTASIAMVPEIDTPAAATSPCLRGEPYCVAHSLC